MELKVNSRAVVFAPFFCPDGPASRPQFVGSVLAETMPVDVVTSDFDHLKKVTRESRQCAPFAEIVYLHALPYRNNVAMARLVSHVLLSLKAAAYFKKNRAQYDVVYATVPFNLMAWLVFKLAGARLKIIDVVDIWPDVLPFPPIAKKVLLPMFAAWKWFFKSAVTDADVVMAVSDEFLRKANKYASKTAKTKRFYIGHERLVAAINKEPIFTLVYVGNLGRLYDFETLLDVLTQDELRGRVQLFLVGAGDRQEWLLEELEKRKIRHRFFGVVFDRERLAQILRSCHAGFNGYINTTASFSYKATTYFAAGLPIINSMNGDLGSLVAKHRLGENYEGGNRDQLRGCLGRLIRNGAREMAAGCDSFFLSQLDLSILREEMASFFALSPKKEQNSMLRAVGAD